MSHAPVRRRTLAAALSLLVAIGGGLVTAQPALADSAPTVEVGPSVEGGSTDTANTSPDEAGTGSADDAAAEGATAAPEPAPEAVEPEAAPEPPVEEQPQSDSASHPWADAPLAPAAAVTGITVSPSTDVEPGDTVTISGSYPATVDSKSTTLYAMYCVDPGDARATGTQCDGSRQQLLSPVALYGGSVPAVGTVADGVWTFEVSMTVPAEFGDHECLADGTEQCGVFVRLDHTFPGNVTLDSFTPVTFAATPEPVAGITVSPSSDLEPGDTVTISGSYPATTDGKSTTLYAMYCVDPGDARATGAQCDGSLQQLLSPVALYGGSVPAIGTVTDGWWTFETTMSVPAEFGDHECLTDGTEQCGVFVRLDHTFPGNFSLDSFSPVTFAETVVPPTAGITVTQSTDLAPGDTVTISGAYPATTDGKSTTLYAMYCVDPGDARATGAQCDGSLQQLLSPVPLYGGSVPAIGTVTDGWWTFETTMTVPAEFGDHECLTDGTEQCGVFVRLDHTFPGNVSLDSFTPVTFASTAGPTDPESTTLSLGVAPANSATVGASVTLSATVSPAAPGTITFYSGSTVLGTKPVTSAAASATLAFTATTAGVTTLRAAFAPTAATQFTTSTASLDYSITAPVVAAGSLRWGIKESFRSYVTGSIAKGAITTSGAGVDGGEFVFGQSTGGTFSGTTGTGTSNYSGSVRFTGHDGLLNLTLSNPIVQVNSSSSATLLVSVDGGGHVAFANLDLAAGSYSTPGNAFAWAGVPASLTSAGASAFSLNGSNFYSPGTSLDPVSFVIGAPSSGGGGGTVAAYAGEREPASIAPATEGITILDPENIVAGGQITATADGFEPNEEGILVVIYSDPVLLARDATADANGVVTWTGRLPSALTGTHTLTFQGSVNRGVLLDIPAKLATASIGCTIEEASLEWGFKESFRSYISGTIANGEWTVSDGAAYETPLFSWADGDGSFDAETGEGVVGFVGSITFTGHGGILNTTVSNPQVRFVDEDTAIILMDVSGTTQEGEAVDAPGVEFVELSLAGATELTDGVLTITDAPAVLLADGATAFGTYEAGESFDPVTMELVLASDCVVAEAPAGAAPVDDAPAADAAPSFWWAWLLAGLALVAIIVAIIVILRRRTAE